MWWQLLVGVLAGLLLLYVILIVLLWRSNRDAPDPPHLRDVVRLVPDVVGSSVGSPRTPPCHDASGSSWFS